MRWHVVKKWARALKNDIYAVWLAARDTRTPWFARVLALIIAAYAVSPIDLIPDFIPVLGYLDDLIIVPLGILLVVCLIPPELMITYREAATKIPKHPISWIAASLFVAFWLVCFVLLVRVFL